MTMEWRIEQWHDDKEYHLYVDGIHRAVCCDLRRARRPGWWAVLYSATDGLSVGGALYATCKQAREWCEAKVGG